jgi:Protein of unknown function (DUF2971)
LAVPKSDNDIAQTFSPLYARFFHDVLVKQEKPLLAHYTSLETIEKILKSHEIWFSNPLFMNDSEERRFGIYEGISLLERTNHLRCALKTDRRIETFKAAFTRFFDHHDQSSSLDVYVFCLSEHPKGNEDGLLSMWRGYGGHGRGAALIFDTSKVTFVPGAPMYLCKVEYGSKTERISKLESLIEEWAQLVEQTDISDDQIPIAAHNALMLFKFYALTSKHSGFAEEHEWRILYMADIDPSRAFEKNLTYIVGAQGVEPKLRFKYERNSAGNYPEQNFGDLLCKILLGPSISSPLAERAFKRMLVGIGRAEYSNRVVASTIPLRPSH